VHPAHGVQFFVNIFAPHNGSGTWPVCVRIFRIKFESILGDRAS